MQSPASIQSLLLVQPPETGGQSQAVQEIWIMIKKRNYSDGFRKRIVLEIMSGQTSMVQIAKRENISTVTLAKWRDEMNTGGFQSENKTEIELRKRIKELEGALADIALENHILKKTEEITRELKRKGNLSGAFSELSSGSKKVAKCSG
jgi:transposase-like protein